LNWDEHSLFFSLCILKCDLRQCNPESKKPILVEGILRGEGCRNFAVEVAPESALILFLIKRQSEYRIEGTFIFSYIRFEGSFGLIILFG
jgi:hypothetical protein